jgi:hypothetical protein
MDWAHVDGHAIPRFPTAVEVGTEDVDVVDLLVVVDVVGLLVVVVDVFDEVVVVAIPDFLYV